MSNGSNDFGVSFSQIVFLEKLLRSHAKVESVLRTNDVQFDLIRSHGSDIQLVCINEYTCGVARVYEVLDVFPETNIIYVGGNWNSYTIEAKVYCLQSSIGLYNSTEINGALHLNDYWMYSKKDKDGNPCYPTKAA